MTKIALKEFFMLITKLYFQLYQIDP